MVEQDAVTGIARRTRQGSVPVEQMHVDADEPLLALDLYCGCGGLTEGLKQAGFKVIGAVDVDALAVETYSANHPEVVVWQTDIRRLQATDVMKQLNLRKGELHLLAGCPPCQGFSPLRTLNGCRRVDDPRNDLVLEFLRFVREMEPRAVMIENVPRLADDERMKQVLEELEPLGYSHAIRVLNAADYGVPQRRRRMILVAGRLGPVPLAAPSRDRVTVRAAIGSVPPPGASGDPLHDLPEHRSEHVLNLIRGIPKNGGSRTSLSCDLQLACHKKCDGFKDVYGRMSWDDVAPTITGGCVNPSKGRFLHPDQDRAITLREAALLQTLPPRYEISLSRGKYPAAGLIGNVLPPEFVRRHAARLQEYLRSPRLAMDCAAGEGEACG